ncbi:MAG TPA: FHA domain-containing protein [Polyangia bacterium]|nr:FHA domain-containing protein [Polyangia bacterium]
MTRGRGNPDGDDSTRQTSLPTPAPGGDEQATRAVDSVGIVAELKALFQSGERKVLPLYGLPDQIVVGRGTAADWQLEDDSLSRKHAQLKWNGHELTVEDLGSANGTRVGARAARTPVPVKPGDTIQLGTVAVTFEMKHAPLGGEAGDPDSTRLVSAPASDMAQIGSTGSSSLPPLTAAPTVVRVHPPEPSVTPKPNAAVFRPERDAARPDEPTRPWDPNAALVHPPEKAIDASELMERLKAAWKTNRRPFVMAGAAVWILILLAVWQVATRPPPEDDSFAGVPPRRTDTAGKNSGATTGTNGKPGANENAGVNENANAANPPLPLDDADRDQLLSDAVAAYDQGRMNDALLMFKKLAADPTDSGAKFMFDLIESRGQGASPGTTP